MLDFKQLLKSLDPTFLANLDGLIQPLISANENAILYEVPSTYKVWRTI